MEKSTLKANAIGWSGQLFQCIAHMAPAAAIIGSVPFMASRAGWALPLGFVLSGILALMISYCLALLSKKYYGASGYFQIHSKALGSAVGFTTSWLFFLYEPFGVFISFFGFGIFILEPFSQAYLGHIIPWWYALIFGNVLITLLSLKKITNSIKATAILGIMEIIIFFALSIVLLVKSDHVWQPSYFTPAASADGIGGILFAFIFGFMCYMGFESGLPLVEETKDRSKATFRGLIWSVIFGGIFFTFVGYASVIGFGPGATSQKFATDFSNLTNPYGLVLSTKAFGKIGPWLILFASFNSGVAGALAASNAIIRVFYSLGRAEILPKKIGDVSPKTNIPVYAVLFSSFLSYLIGFVFYFLTKHGKAEDWFGLIALTCTIPILIIHLMTCISVFVAYKYKEKNDFAWVKHGAMPIVTGIVVLLPIWGSVYYNQDAPMCYAPWVVACWFFIGIGVYFWLRKTKPEKLKTLEHEMELIS